MENVYEDLLLQGNRLQILSPEEYELLWGFIRFGGGHHWHGNILIFTAGTASMAILDHLILHKGLYRICQIGFQAMGFDDQSSACLLHLFGCLGENIQARKIDLVLVTELTCWGRSTLDLFHTLNDLQSWGDCLISQTGLRFDLATPQGRLIGLAGAFKQKLTLWVDKANRVVNKQGVVISMNNEDFALLYNCDALYLFEKDGI